MSRLDGWNRRQCIAGLAAVIAGGSAARPVSAAADKPRWPTLRATLDALISERRAAGVSIAISFHDSPLAYLSAGTLAFDTTSPFNADSICRIYSMTKNVTRIATLLLAEDGKLTLDQPVADVLPEFRQLRVAVDIEKGLASRPATRVMTMRHLITNTSGLGNWTPSSDSGEELHRLYRERGITPGLYGAGRARPGYGAQPATLDEMISRVAEIPLAYEPGTVLHYSIGFDVIPLVIQRITGMTYDAFLQKRLFEPLGMTSTSFQVSDAGRLTTNYDAIEADVNSSHNSAVGPKLPPGFRVADDRATSEWLRPPRLIAGGAGLVSTSTDFMRYAQMLLHDGIYGGTRLMSLETARLATGNIDPPGIAEPNEGVGAGTRALLRSPIIPPGTIGGGGAAGTLFWMDKARAGAVVFMTQVMYGSPARSPFQKPLFSAIEEDLATR